ncbi:ABC transporter permease [Paenibacillus dendritiformis]|uniref:ABC transporter permease n=1 Tax=Paenibacillus dendritiformis TaxID=130049 RepID=UPI000DA833B9|nr:ABC transporter permease [Paenibacillus dendritiformis]PZM67380.1 ABC transporter permease [Paenibacillus dendritiformis]
MRHLLKYELIKIFSRKSVVVVSLLLLLVYGLFIVYDIDYYKDASHKYKPYERVITEQDIAEVLKIFEEHEERRSWPLVERGLLQDIWDVPKLQEHYTKQLAEIRDKLRLSAPGSYEYKQHALHEQLLTHKGPPTGQVYYNKPWANIFYIMDQFGVAFMGVMILIGLAPLYSEEYATGMDSLLLSSRYGKGQLISAKCCAAILYAFICSAAFQLFNLGVIALLFGNLDGADTPLYSISRYMDSHSFWSSPYSWTAGQYYVIQFGVHVIGCIAFALAVMFVSSLSKSSFLTLFIAGCILGAPYVLNDMFNIRFDIIEWLATFSYSQFIRVTRLFTGFETVNIFHFPVLYPVAAVSCVVAVTGVLVWVTRRVFQRHQVT